MAKRRGLLFDGMESPRYTAQSFHVQRKELALDKTESLFSSSVSPGRTYGKSSPRLEVKAAEEAFDKLVGDNMVVMEEDMVAEEKENLKTVEENSVGNEASPGLRSRSRVSKEIKTDLIILMTW